MNSVVAQRWSSDLQRSFYGGAGTVTLTLTVESTKPLTAALTAELEHVVRECERFISATDGRFFDRSPSSKASP